MQGLVVSMARKSTRKLWADYVARGGSAGSEPRGQVSMNVPAQFKGLVLGIDPSLRASGYAILRYSPGEKPQLIETTTLKLKPGLSQIECLGAIGKQVEDFIDQHAVDHVAVEETIYVQNFQTAQILGAARGAAIGVAAMRGLPVFEYAPLRIKQAVVGAGRASKEQVARTVRDLTGVDLGTRFDESDAAATALCHAFTWRKMESP
jgi:crossover junction endodeoxyribonuclease RuvC